MLSGEMALKNNHYYYYFMEIIRLEAYLAMLFFRGYYWIKNSVSTFYIQLLLLCQSDFMEIVRLEAYLAMLFFRGYYWIKNSAPTFHTQFYSGVIIVTLTLYSKPLCLVN